MRVFTRATKTTYVFHEETTQFSTRSQVLQLFTHCNRHLHMGGYESRALVPVANSAASNCVMQMA